MISSSNTGQFPSTKMCARPPPAAARGAPRPRRRVLPALLHLHVRERAERVVDALLERLERSVGRAGRDPEEVREGRSTGSSGFPVMSGRATVPSAAARCGATSAAITSGAKKASQCGRWRVRFAVVDHLSARLEQPRKSCGPARSRRIVDARPRPRTSRTGGGAHAFTNRRPRRRRRRARDAVERAGKLSVELTNKTSRT